MFEQAVLHAGPLRKWAVTLGFAGELLLVGGVLLVPLLWPQLLPRATVAAWISAPAPPPATIKETPLPHVRPTRVWNEAGLIFFRPSLIHATGPAIDAPPPARMGVDGGVDNGDANGIRTALDLINIARPEPVEVAGTPAQRPSPAPPQSIRVSGELQAARLVHRIEPIYPQVARQMRIAGVVELAGVIGTDGRIRELRVTSGHPLLVQTALDAVRQWVYEPTSLGGRPVEVITTIRVVFRLN